jgi:cellulose synthase/poly-beta-1,6-N-acetylglucosamine synthase-like glycosyltransferase
MLNLLDIISIAGSVVVIYTSFVYIFLYLSNRKKLFVNPLPKKLPTVSIIVPAYNEEKTIAATLKSLLKLNYPKNLLEIIAVNDGSTDNTGKIMEKFRSYGVKLLNKRNGGKASALNIGIKYSKGEIIVCMDADSIVERNALKKTLGYFNDPKVAAVSSSVKVFKPKNQIQKLQFLEYLYNILFRKTLAFLNGIFVVPGPFGLYRKSVLKEIGGFQEGNLTEDMEITMRMQAKGYRIENSTNAYTYTIAPFNIKKLFNQRVRWYRGFIINSKQYKKFYFNSSYGDLGLFVLPTYIFFVFFIFILLACLIYTVGFEIFHFINVRLLTGIILPTIKLENPVLFLSVSNVLWMSSIAVSLLIAYLSFRISKEKFVLKMIPTYIISLFLYSFLMSATWLVSIYKELKSEKIKWER